MGDVLRFAVIGDTHYVRRASHKEFTSGLGAQEGTDLWRYVRMNEQVLPFIMKHIQRLDPAFVIHTGDLIQGSGDDEAALAEMNEALSFMAGFGMPVYYAVGNHDGYVGRPGGAAVTKSLLPAVREALRLDKLERGYYRFYTSNCLFIVLDFTTYTAGGEQEAFLERCLREKRPETEHTFLFGHPPLIPVVRPFFSDFDYAASVLNLVAKYGVDAYFCGHTHNQIASLHRAGDRWLPQFKGATTGMPQEVPVQVTDIRPLLPPTELMEYGWGYLEGTAPGWWLVTVNGSDVRVDWHVLDRGICGTALWAGNEKPGFEAVPLAPLARRELPKIEEIRSVRLRLTGSRVSGGTVENGLYQVFINGNLIGQLPRLGSFTCRETMEINSSLWEKLTARNEIRVTTAEEKMCMGGIVLEVETDSALFRSDISPFFANTTEWDKWGIQPLNVSRQGEEIQTYCSFV